MPNPGKAAGMSQRDNIQYLKQKQKDIMNETERQAAADR